ncbi:MAG TPA: hypothetical protein VIK84_00175 [Haloplasmataceae bacterium]
MTKRSKNWFFTITNILRADNTWGGVRFRKRDKPTQETMKDFCDSVTFKEEPGDKATNTVQGLVKTVPDANIIAGIEPDADYTYVPKVSQLPLLISGGTSSNDKINSGGDTTINGFNIDVGVINYTISGITYDITTTTSIPITTADPTYNRIDVIYADSTGLHVSTGVASDTPVANTLTTGQLLVTYVFVTAGGGISLSYGVLYVSCVYGNNYTAKKNDISRPYSTITYAKTQAGSNDIIYVLPGVYNENNLFGNYRYWFSYGADVKYTGEGNIFQNASGICTVRGFGRFICTNTASTAIPIYVGNVISCQLDMECESIESYVRAVRLAQNADLSRPHKIKANRIYSQTLEAVRQDANAHGIIECPDISTDSTTIGAIGLGNGFVGSKGTIFRNCRIYANNYAVISPTSAGGIAEFENCYIKSNYNNANGHGIQHVSTHYFSSLTLKNVRIEVSHPDASWFDVKTVADPQNIILDNNVTTNAKDVIGTSPVVYLADDNYVKLDNSDVTIDITGLTSIDLKLYQNYTRIILSSTNASETLNSITNAPKHHAFKLIPENGLSVTLTGTGAGVATADQIVLESASIVLNGTNGDWAEFRNEKFGIGSRIINSKIYI